MSLFGRNIGTEINAYEQHFRDQEDLITYVAPSAQPYLRDTCHSSGIFFILTKDGIQGINLQYDESCDQLAEELFETLDQIVKEEPKYYGYYPTFRDYVYNHRQTPGGNYLKAGKGQIIAWDNLINYSEYDLCYGIIVNEANNWLVAPVNEVTKIESIALNRKLDTIFRKYVYIMLASIGGVFLLFIIISFILSKKLADPVVSEHDMLVKVNEMKTAFLSDASHELKTPLAAMSGYAQNAEMDLANGGNPAIVQEKLKRISSESNRMALMVTQILDATRIEEGRMVLELAPCDIESLVRETVETYFAVLNKNNNRLALRIPLELPKVEADSSRLQRVFVNLISNALKHTKNGTILVKAEEDETECRRTRLLGEENGTIKRELKNIDTKERYSLKNLPVVIGKLEGSVDICLDDDSVSRLHARFFEQDGEIFLEDLNSTNGCSVNEIPLENNEKVQISPGDRILIGETEFIFN